MKQCLTIVILILSSVCVYGQKIEARTNLLGYSKLYHEDGSRLSKSEIDALSDYGFDADKFKRVNIACSVGTIVCWTSVAMALRKPDDRRSFPFLFLVSAGYSVYYYGDAWKVREVGSVNKKMSFGVSESGVGIQYHF